ncbi:MAG: hypothetical protein ACJAZ3_001592 [Sphingobacteriales bacterium]|jgi:hypothetical protein
MVHNKDFIISNLPKIIFKKNSIGILGWINKKLKSQLFLGETIGF